MSVDHEILSNYGGVRNNDLNNYINTHLSSDECMDGITLQSSSYYLQDQFVKAIYNSTNDFSIISLNIQSIRANLTNFYFS